MRAHLGGLTSGNLDLLTIGCRLSTAETCDGDFILVFGTANLGGTVAAVYDVAVFVDAGEAKLVGALPRLVTCAATQQQPCERLLGGMVGGPDYRYWVDSGPIPRPLPAWTFFRWTP